MAEAYCIYMAMTYFSCTSELVYVYVSRSVPHIRAIRSFAVGPQLMRGAEA